MKIGPLERAMTYLIFLSPLIMVAVVPNWFNTFNTFIVYIFISL